MIIKHHIQNMTHKEAVGKSDSLCPVSGMLYISGFFAFFYGENFLE